MNITLLKTFVRKMFATNFVVKAIISVVLLIAVSIQVASFVLPQTHQAQAAINLQINYQGKLTNTSDVAVANGDYNMEFILYDAPSGGSTLWTETRTGGNKVTVTNGLFSVMLGSVTALTSVDFNQTVYLGVNIGGTGSPSWDGEMTPRKTIGSVPSAFLANGVVGTGGVRNTIDSATALTIAKSGSNYALQVDTSAGSAVTGLKVTSNAATSGLALAVISSGTNENLTLDAKGSGTISLGAASTGNLILGGSTGDILLGGGSGSTGCTVTNSTGAFACTAGGSFTTLGLTGAVSGGTSFTGSTFVKAPYIYGGDMTTTYGGYSGGVFGGTTTHAVLDFVDNGSRIGEFYTTSSTFNFFTDVGKALNFYTNADYGGAPAFGIDTSHQVILSSLDTDITAPTTSGTTRMVITDANGQLSFTSAAVPSGTNTGDVTLAAFGSTANANGASLSGQALTLQPASASFPGGVSTTTQSFAGDKTFVNNTTFTGTTTQNNTATFNTDVDLVFAGTENLSMTSTITGTTAVDLFSTTVTNQTSSGTQRGIVLTNANDAANAVTESLILIDNAETTASTLTDAILITSSGVNDGITDAIDASASNITNAINIGANAIAGTNFSVTGAGAVTAVGVNSGSGLLQGTGGLTLTGAVSITNNGSSTIDLNTGTSTGLVTIGGGSGTFSLQTTNIDISNTGAITNATGFNGLIVTANTGVITTGTWNGTAVGAQYGGTGLNTSASSGVPSINSGTWQANTITPNGVMYGGASNALSFTVVGSTGQCLVGNTGAAPSWSSCAGLVTLQAAYDATSGNTITTTTARNIAFTLADVVTPTSFTIENQDTAATSAQRIFNSIATGTATNGLLIEQTGAGTLTNGIQIAETAGTITDGILITGTLGNILNSGSIDITGTGAITGATGFNGLVVTANTGVITTGTWNGSLITGTYGGTGVNNGSNTITLGGNINTAGAFTTSGAFGLTLTQTGTTNVTLPTSGTLATLAGAETLTNKAGYNGLVITANTGVVTTGTWNGTAITDTYVADTLTVDSSSSVHWNALNNYPAACSAGSAISQLADTTNTCTAFNTDTSITLQDAYGAGNSIETASNTSVVITETTTGAVTGDLLQLTVNQATGGTYSGDALQITMDGFDTNSYTGNGINIVIDQSQNTGSPILVQDDAAAVLFQLSENGAITLGAATAETTAITITDTDYTNALSIGDNNITGTTYTVTGTTATIDFTNFDVSSAGALVAVGVNSGSGLLQGTGGLTLTGTTNINATGTAATNIGNSTGVLTIASGGSSGWTNTSGNLTIQTATSGTMTIDSAGALSLGTTNSTSTALGKTGTTLTVNPTSWTATPTISGLITATSGITANGVGTFNTDVDLVFAGTENLSMTSTITGTTAVDLFSTTVTNQTSSGTQRGIVLTNANDAANAVTESLILIDNAETTASTLTDAILITSSGVNDGITDAIDASASNITNAINIGANAIAGTNFSVTGAGAIVGVGVNSGSGLLQGTGGLTLTGAVSITNNGTSTIDLNTGTSSGLVTIGGGSGTFSLQTTNIDISNTGAITNATGFNGLIVTANTGVITTGTWNGTAVGSQYGGTGLNTSASSGVPSINSGTWQANAITQNGVMYGGASNALSFTAVGTTGQCLVGNTGAAPTWSSCAGLTTLDAAYTAGATITTDSGSNVAITLQDVVTPTSFTIENQDTAATSVQRIFNSIATGTATNGLLIEQTGAGTLTNGIQIAETAGTITDGILITGTLGNILNSGSIDITGAGAITGATGIVSSGTIQFSTLTSNGPLYTSAGNGTLTTTAPTSGAIGYWSRTSTTISPTTANDIILQATTNTTGADLGITNTGVYTGTGIFNLTANSATTGTLGLITGNGMTTGSLLSLSSSSAAALTGQKGLNVALTGALTGAQTTYGGYFSNTRTGASAVNVGLYATASGATGANYAAIFDAGNVGINTTGPDRKLDVLDASNPQLRLTQADGTVYSDLQTDSSGILNISNTGRGILINNNVNDQNFVNITNTTSGTAAQSALRVAQSLGGLEYLEVAYKNASNSAWGSNVATVVAGSGATGGTYIGNIGSNPLYFITNNTHRWSMVGSTGVFQSNGAQTIQTSTGNLTLATAAGSGNIILSTDSTGTIELQDATNVTGALDASTTLAVGTANAFTVNTSGAITAATGIISSGTIQFSTLTSNGPLYTSAGNGTLTTTAPTSGALGYWSRTSTTISPTTANDILSVANSTTTGADLALTNSGVYTGTGVFNLTANSATTGTLASITGNGATTGSLLSLSSSSAAALTGQKGLNVALTGALTGAQTTYGGYYSNTRTGATAVNVGLYSTASGATGANYAAIFDTGNVGIGTTTPSERLEIGSAGNLSLTSGYLLQKANSRSRYYNTANSNYSDIYNPSAGGSAELSLTDGSATGIRLDGTGKVGIGDTSPVALLTVGSGDLFQVNSSGAIAAVVGITSSSNYVQSAGTFSLTSANTTQVTTASAVAINVNSLTTGTGLFIASSSLTSGSLVDLQVTGAGGISSQKVVNVSTSGAVTGAQTTYGGYFSNTHTGASATNVALYASASGATTGNYAIVVPDGGGNVGIGNSAPASKLVIDGGSANGYFGFEVSNPNPTLYMIGNATNGYYPNIDFRPIADSALGGSIQSYSSNGGLYIDNRGVNGALLVTNGVSNRTSTILDELVISHNTTGTPAANYGTGILISGETTTTPGQDMSRIASYWTDATHATRTSNLGFSTALNGTLSERLTVQGSTGNLGVGDTTPAALLTVGSGDLFQVNSSGAIAAATGVTSSGTITFSGLGGGGTQCVTANNTGVLGVASCGSALTPWTSDIDADGYDLNDLSNILFRETTGAPTSTDVGLFRDNTGDLNLNVLTGKTFNVQVAGVDEYNFSSTALAMNSNNITGVGTAITATAGVTLSSTSANLALTTGTSGNITLAPASTGSVQITSGVTTGTTTSSGLSLVSNSVNSGTGAYISTTALTSGNSLQIQGSGATMTTGGELIDLVLGANTVGAGLTITSTGAYTGVGAADGLINVTTNGLTSGYAMQIAHTTSVISSNGSLMRLSSSSVDTGVSGFLLSLSSSNSNTGTAAYLAMNSLTSGTAFRIQGSGATMTTGGELIDLVLGANTVGAGITITGTGAYTGTGAADGLINIVANSLSTGYGSQYSFTGLSSGTGLLITGGTSMTTNGELIDLNMGAATAGNGINIATTGVYTGTGLTVLTANSATTGTIQAISATALTTGRAETVTLGSALTTGGAYSTTGASYLHGTETGSLFNLVFTDATTAAVTSTTNGILISPTVNVTTGASGTKTINGVSITPTFTACSGGSTCNPNAVNVGNVTDGTGITSAAIRIGTGWDTAITSAGNYVQSAGTMSHTSANTNQGTTGSAFAHNYDSINTGTGIYISTSVLTTGKAIQVSGSGSNMLTNGELIDLVLGSNTVGSGMTITSTGAYTGVGSDDGLLNITANSLTTGYAFQIPHISSVISGTGSLMRLSSSSVDTGTAGTLLSLASTGSTAGTIAMITNNTASFTGTSLSVSTTGATTGRAISATLGTTLTTGGSYSTTGASYLHTGTETGSLVSLAYTDASSNGSGTAITNGILLSPTINTTASAGSKTINGMSISPAYTACGTTAGTCAYNGITQSTAAVTQTTTNALTIVGSNLATAGALVQNTAAGSITWVGQNIQMPNITQTTGTVTSTGIKITGGTVTSGTSYALTTDVNAGNVGLGITAPKFKTEMYNGTLATSVPAFNVWTSGVAITDSGNIAMRMGVLNLTGSSAGYPSYIQPTDLSGAYYNLLLNPLGGNVGIGTSTPTGAYGILQVNGDIGMTGNTSIRQSTASDGNTLTILATQVVAANSNANGYGYSGGGLLASNSPSGSSLLLDVGATVAGTAHRLKVANDGSGVTGTLFYGTPTLTTLYGNSATGNVGIGTTSPTGNLSITQTATATGALKGIVYTGAVNTNQTLSTEIPSLTVTTAGRQWATGALTTQREVLITQPTYSFVGASTITDAATVGIVGAPIKSTNATITNTHGLLIQGGAVSTATNSYGLTVNAQTGATNNYAAAFLGGNVGIGTASPGAKLDVSGDLFVNSGTSGYTRIYTDVNNVPNITTSLNALVLASGGTRNVVLNGTSLWLAGADINYISGSGTVLSVTSSSAGIGILVPKSNLHVVSSGATTGLGSTPADRGLAISGVGGQDRIYMESTNATSGQRVFNIDNTSGVLSFNSLNDAASSYVNQNIFNVRYDGYIGIGTSTPGTTLGVQSSVSSDNLRLGDINGGYYYKIGRNTGTGTLDFTGTQTSYRGYLFNNPDDNFVVVNSGGNNRVTSMTSTAAAAAGIKLYNSSRNYSWFLDNRGSLDSPNDRFGLFNNAGTEVITALTGGNIGIGDNTPNSLFTVGSGDLFQVNTSGDVFSEFTTLNGSSTANGSGTGSTTLTLTSGTNFDVGNYVKVSSTSCATGVNICYAKITAKSTNVLTISPALDWANSSAVVEMHVPEIGGTNTASTLANRYGRGYFIDGVVTGNGSTYFSDRSINLTSGNLSLTGGNLGIPVGSSGAASIFFNGDVDTGVFSNAANEVSLTAHSTERLRANDDGVHVEGGLCVLSISSCIGYGSLSQGTIYANNETITKIDLAENYPSKDSTLQPGEVIMIDDAHAEYIKRGNTSAGSKAIGVVSTAPGITLGGNENKYAPDKVYPVALVGRVPVKVTNENGPILPGDFLTVSATMPGFAMKAISAGPIIGQALEGFNQASGSIISFIKPTDFNGVAIEKQMSGLVFDYSISTITIAQSSEAILSRLISQLATLDENNLSQVNTDLVIAGAEVISPNVTTGVLRANTFASAASDGGISVESATVFKGGLQVDSIGSLGGLLTFQSDVEFIGTPYLNKDTAGFAVIKPGAVSVDIIFGNSYVVQPIVGASISFEQSADLALVTDPAAQELLKQQAITEAQAFMGEGVSYVITNKTSKGFTIVLNKTASKELRFSWTAFAVKNANVFTSIDPSQSAPAIPPVDPTPPTDSAIIPSDGGSVAGDVTPTP